MNPAALIPKADAIPVAWGWFEGLNILTFSLHLVLANALVGGAIIALMLARKDANDIMAKDLGGNLPTLLALTVNLGVAPLLFLQVLYGQFFYTSTVLSAVWWLSIIAMLIAGYYALYLHQHRQKTKDTQGTKYLAISLGLTLIIGFILTNIMTLMLRPGTWEQYFLNRQGWLLNLYEPTLIPRYLHFILASLAIGGLALALIAKYGKNKGTAEAEKAIQTGMVWFTTSSILQMSAGFWWLVALDRPVQLVFMGGNIGATILIVFAIGLTAPLLIAGFKRMPLTALGMTVLIVLAMCGVRAIIRTATLGSHFKPEAMAVTGESSPLLLFLVSLAIGLACIAYMIKLFLRPGKEV